MAGHLGVRKTHDRILNHFWWPTLRKDVSEYCRSCHTCQVVGKPNQKIPAAPLKPIPAFDEPFSRVIVDCVGQSWILMLAISFVLFYFILFYFILFYFILFYFILFYLSKM